MLRFALLLLSMTALAYARPIVRHIRSTHEFDRLMKKHSTQTGLPVIVDFYSDGCGPCRMIAPIFKKLAQEVGEKAVFVKVDTNALHELSSRYGVRSLPTFKFFLGGRKVNEFSGAGEQQLRQFTKDVIQKAEWENVMLPMENLVSYYGQQDASKTSKDIEKVYKKCVDQVKDDNPDKLCVGAVARNLAKSLKKKYGSGPEFETRFFPEEPSTSEQAGDKKASEGSGSPKKSNKGNADKPNLHLATKEQLLAEIESRLDAERDAQVEEEEDDDAEFEHGWEPSEWPERVTIIGGGPAGLSAAIYAARAGLKPVVVAPPMGGQLQGKGVDVENYREFECAKYDLLCFLCYFHCKMTQPVLVHLHIISIYSRFI
jgi:thioredoxin